MDALVVYESLWGNTEQVARAIAEGLGPDTKVLSTAEAKPGDVAQAGLLVVGSPVFGFSVPSDQMIASIRSNPVHAKNPPENTQPSMRAWLSGVERGSCPFAAFETRIWWSPGGSIKGIEKALAAQGHRRLCPGGKFLVTGQYGPLKDGELDRAREWGRQLPAQA